MPTTVGVGELKRRTSRIIRAVRQDLSEDVVTLRGEPVAGLRPLTGEEAQWGIRRACGSWPAAASATSDSP